MTGTTASPRISAERWIEWTPEKQLQILPLRVRMTEAVMVRPEEPHRRSRSVGRQLVSDPDLNCRGPWKDQNPDRKRTGGQSPRTRKPRKAVGNATRQYRFIVDEWLGDLPEKWKPATSKATKDQITKASNRSHHSPERRTHSARML
jgi:hypothetical protein